MFNETIITNFEADRSLDLLIKGEVLKVSNFDELCRSYFDQNYSEIKPPKTLLNDSAIRLLEAVIEHPMQPSNEYIKFAGISPNSLSKALRILLEQGYIKEHRVSNGRGRPSLLWEPLEKASELLKKNRRV